MCWILYHFFVVLILMEFNVVNRRYYSSHCSCACVEQIGTHVHMYTHSNARVFEG